MAVFLNTFTPIATNKLGRTNASTNKIPLYVDGSCRREPDFQNPYPAITQLCRPNKLVTRLEKGDLVIYLTKKNAYGKSLAHWKFISILEVICFAENHEQAVNYYLNKQLPVSQNIICRETTPYPLYMTHGISPFRKKGLTPETEISLWNRSYENRASNYSKVAITKVWNDKLFLHNPPIVSREMMYRIFGRIPASQTPPKINNKEWSMFRKELKL